MYADTFLAAGRAVFGYGDDVGLGRGVVERHLACAIAVLASATEPTLTLPPKPRCWRRGHRNAERRDAERAEAEPRAGEDRPVEELAAGDAELVEVDRLVDHRAWQRRVPRAPPTRPTRSPGAPRRPAAPALALASATDASSLGVGRLRRPSTALGRLVTLARLAAQASRGRAATAPSPAARPRRAAITTTMAMAMPHDVRSYSSKKIPSFQGKTKLKPGPRKNEPMMTSTAHISMKIVKIAIANFRSFGLVRRVLVDERRQHEQDQRDAGDGHARDHRVEHREQLLETEEVPRRLRRVRRLVDVGEAEQRRAHERREDGERRGQTIRIDANSMTSRCGQVWTLSCASARVCWIEPDLTTVSSRWV